MKLRRRVEIFLAFEKPCLAAIQLITRQEHIRHSVILVRVKEKLHCRTPMAELQLVFGLGFNPFGEFEPGFFPSHIVARF